MAEDPSNPRHTDRKKEPHKTEKERQPTRKPEDIQFSKAFELYEGQIKVPTASEIAESKNAHIAQVTVVEGEPLNIEDLSRDGRFGKGPFSDADGFTTKSVLCMPIHNSDRTIIGVTQLINKINGQPFDDNDEHIIEAFSIFTGLGIHNCQMYENACQLMAKQSVALEVLSYHATASKEEAERIMGGQGHMRDTKVQGSTFEQIVERIPSADDYRLYTYDFADMCMSDDDTIKATIRMFMDANLINQFKIPYETMCRWVCTVKKNYRPVTYHNWRHAFNVCQTMFTMLYTGELRPKFDAVEVFALMAACLCHDLDHRGTNNAFQVKVASPLAMLYSTSVLEHHHFDHCIMIINSEGNNIFQSFTPEEYRRAIKILEHAILSTDLALYFKKRGDFKVLVESGERDFHEESKKDLLKAMMMTACDVAAITKPWKVQKEIAQLVTAEFFEQGDIEKIQLGEKPIPMMDREKKDELPKMQVDFIDFICTPVYEAFSTMFPRLTPFYEGLLSNRHNWSQLAQNNSGEDVLVKDDPKPSSSTISTKPINGHKDNQKTHAKSQSKRTSRSPKPHRLPMSTRRSPQSVRRLSDTPLSPSTSSRRSFQITYSPHKLTSSPTKNIQGAVGKMMNSTMINSRTCTRGGLGNPLFAKISEPLKPLNDGCANNRRHWEELAVLHKEGTVLSGEGTEATGKVTQEEQVRRESNQQDHIKEKQDNSINSNQVMDTSLKCNSKPLENQKDNCNKISSNHNSFKQESNGGKQPHSNVNSVKTENTISSSPPTPGIEGKDKEKKRSVRIGESKKSSKSSKSNFCSVS